MSGSLPARQHVSSSLQGLTCRAATPTADETADGTEADEDSEEALATLLVLIFVIWLLAGL